jgi:putative FmdB family regulatory protein
VIRLPIYEFRCQSCGAAFSRFFRSREVESPSCEACGGSTERLMSASVHLRGERQLLDSLDRKDLVGRATGDGGLPSERQFADWARHMHDTVGDTLGQDFRAMAEKAEAGENPVERLGVEHTLNYNIERRKAELSGNSGSEAPALSPPA